MRCSAELSLFCAPEHNRYHGVLSLYYMQYCRRSHDTFFQRSPQRRLHPGIVIIFASIQYSSLYNRMSFFRPAYESSTVRHVSHQNSHLNLYSEVECGDVQRQATLVEMEPLVVLFEYKGANIMHGGTQLLCVKSSRFFKRVCLNLWVSVHFAAGQSVNVNIITFLNRLRDQAQAQGSVFEIKTVYRYPLDQIDCDPTCMLWFRTAHQGPFNSRTCTDCESNTTSQAWLTTDTGNGQRRLMSILVQQNRLYIHVS